MPRRTRKTEGVSHRTLARELGITEQEAKKLVEEHPRSVPAANGTQYLLPADYIKVVTEYRKKEAE